MNVASKTFVLLVLVATAVGQALTKQSWAPGISCSYGVFSILSQPISEDSSRVAIKETEVAPGLRLTSDALVWVLADDGATKRLVPITHRDAEIRNNTGTNLARSAVWAKQKKDLVIAGVKAETRLRTGRTTVFVQLTEAEEKEISKSGPSGKVTYAIVKLEPEDKERVVGRYEFSRFKGSPTLKEHVVEAKQGRLADSEWLQVTPAQPLPPGEYALVQLMPGQNSVGAWVFDFGVD